MERTNNPPLNTSDSPEKSAWQSPQVSVLSSTDTQGGKGLTVSETLTFDTNGPS